MKMIKNIFRSLIIFTIIFSGCKEDFKLDLIPVSALTDASYWQTSEHWKAHMNGIHSRYRTHIMQFLRLGEFRSDIWGQVAYTGSTVQELSVHMNTISAEDPGITNFAGFYANINQINLFIDKTLNKSVLSESEKDFYLGQAYGLRAFYYFHLLRSWGNVVIQEDPSYSFDIKELEKAASTASEVMEFIKEDIDNSEKYFGTNYSFDTKVKWSKSATLMLKGDVYLWSSRQMGGGTPDANIAKSALTDIQTNVPSLKLESTFRDVFKYNNKENNEIIFAIRNAQDEYLFSWSSFVTRTYQFNDSFVDSLSGLPYSPQIHNIINEGGTLYYSMHNEVYNGFLNGDTRKFESMQAAYIYENEEYVQQPGIWQNKFQGSFYLGNRIWTDDYPIYRYADLLLLLAEAKSLLGEDPANEINLVRQRAFGETYKPLVQGYPNQAIDNDINEALLKERLCEFLLEGKRWYDLRRFGVEYVTKYTFASPDRLLWPIDVNTLTDNRALTQTQGY